MSSERGAHHSVEATLLQALEVAQLRAKEKGSGESTSGERVTLEIKCSGVSWHRG